MVTPKKTSRVIDSILWISQIILAVSFVWAAWMKLFQPIGQLSAMWPWTGQIPTILVKATGGIDVLSALGLILPAWLRIRPILTPIAACGIIVLMLCATIFHVIRGEASVIGVNIVFASLAAFIAWGRFKKAPITLA